MPPAMSISSSSRILLGLVSPITRTHRSRRTIFASKIRSFQMGPENSQLIAHRKHANFRLCNVSGYKTDVIEICAEDPALHILFFPGNPGFVSFYTFFLESLYEFLEGTASVTAVGLISHTEKVGHSIDAYISIEMFKQFPEKPFLAVDTGSRQQSAIKKIATFLAALVGSLPTSASRFLVKQSLGKSWSATAVEALYRNVLKYHTMRNMLFMALTEFEKLVELPDWVFMKEKQTQIAFLFDLDDHWGPLQMLDEIVKQVPGAFVEIEKEGHNHAFSCTEAGSIWVAQFVASLIRSQKSNSIPKAAAAAADKPT